MSLQTGTRALSSLAKTESDWSGCAEEAASTLKAFPFRLALAWHQGVVHSRTPQVISDSVQEPTSGAPGPKHRNQRIKAGSVLSFISKARSRPELKY